MKNTKKLIRETKSYIQGKTITFTMSDLEYQRFEEWRLKMKKKYSQSTDGGTYTFMFTPTGIGADIVIKRSTGEEINVTDHDSW
jgi:hypothetical protein